MRGRRAGRPAGPPGGGKRCWRRCASADDALAVPQLAELVNANAPRRRAALVLGISCVEVLALLVGATMLSTRREQEMKHTSLTDLVTEQFAHAQAAPAGRASVTIHGGREHALRQTLVALLAGQSLAEHETNGEATLQVLRGSVRLNADGESWDGSAGDLVTIPPLRHSLDALEDSAVLLTVVVTPTDEPE